MSLISNVPAQAASTGNLNLSKQTSQPSKPVANPAGRADQALFTSRALAGAFEPTDAPLLTAGELLASAQTAMLAQAHSSPSGVLALLQT
ncbi:hypothetical protein OM076_12710 [Solirubrobacter ginsenosidimutans]|uniref:Uncharacterized protein n=1 Tax=Solirubrobacter ginsenosidimutans TaxID=490573 RepID=A0A9X3MTS6_9ACTN|nr:hypothetical protein [Solirubrobacter ginsenosidimutans]MDA0161133.1 hypothetical protein [Solirubrobacter ginsenosidimutans]